MRVNINSQAKWWLGAAIKAASVTVLLKSPPSLSCSLIWPQCIFMIDHNASDQKCISEMNLIQRHRAFSFSSCLFLCLQTCVINHVYYLMSFPFEPNVFTLHPQNVCVCVQKVTSADSLFLPCMCTDRLAHTHLVFDTYWRQTSLNLRL